MKRRTITLDNFSAQREKINQFYRSLFDHVGDCGQVIEIRAIGPGGKEVESLFYDSADELIHALPELITTRQPKFNLYHGVCSRPDRAHKKQADIVTLSALWCDCDVKGSGGKAKADLLADITGMKSVPFEPSFVIDSGNGFHCYWFLREPIDVSIPSTQRRQAREVLFGIKERLLGGDATFNLDRVLRVPGSFNVKEAPLPVKIVAVSGKSYMLSDFIEMGIADPAAPDEFDSVKTSIAAVTIADKSSWPEALKRTLAANNELGRLWRSSFDDWLRDHPGNSPSEMLFALAVELITSGYDDDGLIGSVITSHSAFNPKHKADWLARTINKAHDAAAHRPPVEIPTSSAEPERPQSASTPAPTSPPANKPQVKATKYDRPEVITAATLYNRELPEIKWIVPGLLPAGLTILSGRAKIGKSWIALNLGIAIAAGGVALGAIRVEPGPVLYIALEDNQRRLKKRLNQCCHESTPPDQLYLCTTWPKAQVGVMAIRDWLTEHPGTRLVIVDTLSRFVGIGRGKSIGGTLYDVQTAIMEPLQAIATDFNIALMCVTHPPKSSYGDPLLDISGSAGIGGVSDTTWNLTKERGRADAYLKIVGRDLEDDLDKALEWDRTTAQWIIRGDADEFRRSKEQAEILLALRDSAVPLPLADLVKITQKHRNAVWNTMTRLVQDGVVKTVGRGLYTLSQPKIN